MLKEPVIIHIDWSGGEFNGELCVGQDGLPEIEVYLSHRRTETYRPATFPAAWSLQAVDPSRDVNGAAEGVLIAAWHEIERIQQRIRDAQREAEVEERRERCDIEQFKADANAKGTR